VEPETAARCLREVPEEEVRRKMVGQDVVTAGG
jgi:hypothetical protein